MKKLYISLIVVAMAVLVVLGIGVKGERKTEYLRIHIRADSNLEEAQQVKYKVKDAVVEFLTPYVAECDSKKKAEECITKLLPEIENVANKVLQENGFSYTCNAKINNEKFPTRVYEDLELSAGFYDALILELGSGKGDNWWCVVYPPLCFKEGNGNYIYKSKIYEIISDFFGN